MSVQEDSAETKSEMNIIVTLNVMIRSVAELPEFADLRVGALSSLIA